MWDATNFIRILHFTFFYLWINAFYLQNSQAHIFECTSMESKFMYIKLFFFLEKKNSKIVLISNKAEADPCKKLNSDLSFSYNS